RRRRGSYVTRIDPSPARRHVPSFEASNPENFPGLEKELRAPPIDPYVVRDGLIRYCHRCRLHIELPTDCSIPIAQALMKAHQTERCPCGDKRVLRERAEKRKYLRTLGRDDAQLYFPPGFAIDEEKRPRRRCRRR
ncbi:unnamed protein product, partial [Thelazia callipaeda]|uniref:Uncharacterized protein n=1 Tax=Thelazia callipaeda TaxID=103827 RepID=A0A0N5CT96_THECL